MHLASHFGMFYKNGHLFLFFSFFLFNFFFLPAPELTGFSQYTRSLCWNGDNLYIPKGATAGTERLKQCPVCMFDKFHVTFNFKVKVPCDIFKNKTNVN